MKSGMSDMLADNKIADGKESFKCYYVKWDPEVTETKLQATTVDDCHIKKASDGVNEVNNLEINSDSYPFKHMQNGFYPKSDFLDLYKDSKDVDVQGFVSQVEHSDFNKYLFNLKTNVESNYRLELFVLYVVGAQADYHHWLNSMVAANIATTADFKLLPDLVHNNFKVDYIQDFSYPNSDDAYFNYYFSEDLIAVHGSGNCVKEADLDFSKLPKKITYINNEAREFDFDWQSNESKVLLKHHNKSKLDIDLKSIYNCRIWHNVLPFATNANDRDKSFCGLGWGQGLRDSFGNTNSMLLFVKDYKYDYECVLKSRSIQKYLVQTCSVDTNYNKECLESADQKSKEKKSEAVQKQEEKKKSVEDLKAFEKAEKLKKQQKEDDSLKVEDTAVKKAKTHQYTPKAKEEDTERKTEKQKKKDAETSGDSLEDPSEPGGPQWICTSNAHGPSVEYEQAFYSLKEVILTLTLQDPKLDPKQYFSPELGTFSKKYSPHCCGQSCQMKLLAEYCKEDKDKIEKKDPELQNVRLDKIVLPASPEIAKISTTKINKNKKIPKIPRVTDLIMKNKQTIPTFEYWCEKVNKSSLKVAGRGTDLKYSELYYNKMYQLCDTLKEHNTPAPTKHSLHATPAKKNEWFDLVDKDDSTIKKFKFNKAYNGDVLTSKKGCCTSFVSERAALTVEWCDKTMRYKLGKNPFKYQTLQGAEIKPEEFDGKSCLDVKPMKKDPHTKVSVKKGKITIKQKNKPTTTAKNKKVENKKKDSKKNKKDAKKTNKKDSKKNDPKTPNKPSDPDDNKDPSGKPEESKPDAKPDADADPEAEADPEADPEATVSHPKTKDSADPSTPDNEPVSANPKSANHPSASKHKEEESAECDGNMIRKLGQYTITIDKENKVTVKSKAHNPVEKIVNAYRLGNLVFIYFQDGSYLKYYLDTAESVRIFADKATIAHFYPDSSYMVDDKKKQLRHINNRYGVKATFDIAGNKYLPKKVKDSFRYGEDTVYVIEDDTIIIKKADGKSVIMNDDKTIDLVNEDGTLVTKKDIKKQVELNLKKKNAHRYLQITDMKGKETFYSDPSSRLERIGSRLFEVTKDNAKYEILPNGGKKYSSEHFNETCYPSKDGYRYNKQNGITQMCKCFDNFRIDLWTCKQSVSLSYTIKWLDRKNKLFENFTNWTDKYKDDEYVLKELRENIDNHKLNTNKNNKM